MINDKILKINLCKIHESVSNWQKSLKKSGLTFSKNSKNKFASVDSISLHIDLAYMLNKDKNWCIPYINQLIDCQRKEDGLWQEVEEPPEEIQKSNPRINEMAKTYLGFQVSSLLLNTNNTANPINFWNFLLEFDFTLEDYIKRMPWETSPWGAGGWVDSIGTMFKANSIWGDKRYDLLIEKLIAILNNMQCNKTGLWGGDKIQGLAGQINGSYHLMRGTYFLNNKSIPNQEKLFNSLIDYLKTDEHFLDFKGEACYDIDAFYLLYKLNKILPNYRRKEVNTICLKRLENLLSRTNIDGAYGYFIEESQDFHNYYFVGPKVYGRSDIQGTVFYLTTIYFLSSICFPQVLVPWKTSFTHA